MTITVPECLVGLVSCLIIVYVVLDLIRIVFQWRIHRLEEIQHARKMQAMKAKRATQPSEES